MRPTSRSYLRRRDLSRLYAIQFAKLSGLYVIATALEQKFDLVRSLGTEAVVDYADPVGAAKQIREAAPNLELTA